MLHSPGSDWLLRSSRRRRAVSIPRSTETRDERAGIRRVMPLILTRLIAMWSDIRTGAALCLSACHLIYHMKSNSSRYPLYPQARHSLTLILVWHRHPRHSSSPTASYQYPSPFPHSKSRSDLPPSRAPLKRRILHTAHASPPYIPHYPPTCNNRRRRHRRRLQRCVRQPRRGSTTTPTTR
jgi:hypothetical protein